MALEGFDDYLARLLAARDEPVLLEMEREAREREFPIVGRFVGPVLEILARSVGARRVFELGSGFGYSAYWFARAVGEAGEVHCTDRSEENERRALELLARAGLAGPIRFHVGDALEALAGVEGAFDVIFCDADKGSYPACWAAARDRIRPGGLYLCDNAFRWGEGSVVSDDDGHGGRWSEAVRRHNREVFGDRRYLATILPIREGVLVALRVG